MPKPLIIFDLNRTLYDPEQDALMEGAREVLNVCVKRGYSLALVSRNEAGRNDIIDRFELRNLFSAVELVEEKSEEIFLKILKDAMIFSPNVFVVGDVVSQEIAIGNRCGFTTIWFCVGKFKDFMPTHADEQPDYVVTRFSEILPILDMA